MALRLSLDADLLLRLVTDTGGASLQLAGIAPREAPTLSWRRHRVGIVTTLLALCFAVGSFVWLSSPPGAPTDVAPAHPALPELPPPPPAPLALPEPVLQRPPPAPPVIRLEPVPEPPAAASSPSPVVQRPRALAPASVPPGPVPPASRPAAPAPAAPAPPASPPAAAPVARPATPAADVLDLFDDTK